jgi:hypothetical protein
MIQITMNDLLSQETGAILWLSRHNSADVSLHGKVIHKGSWRWLP